MAKFDFERWFGIIDEDNKADEYYDENEDYVYCIKCDSLMVPTGTGYRCPVCGCTEGY